MFISPESSRRQKLLKLFNRIESYSEKVKYELEKMLKYAKEGEKFEERYFADS